MRKRWRQRVADKLEEMRARPEAKKMLRRMLETGDWSEFRGYVADLKDEEIEEFLFRIDQAVTRKPQLMIEPSVRMEYQILIEERQRRDEDGTSKEEG